MRPVNLIPPEERRGDSAPSRTGALSYIVVGALAFAFLAVTVTALLGKSVSDKEAEVATLEEREAEAAARAQSLAPFAQFQQIKDARVETVNALAASRFDWERVMRELSKVLPAHVWLTGLTGTVSPDVDVEKASKVNLRADVSGPALELVGCARSQRDVARLIASIGDIDGITRVTAAKSEKPASETAGGGGGDKATSECRTRSFIARFELVAAFDAVEVPEGAVPPAPAEEATPEASPTEGSSGEDGGVSEVEQGREEARESVAEAEEDVKSAKKIAQGKSG